MTVESTTARIAHATNGTTGPFTVPFYFLEESHLAVYYTDAAGNLSTLALNVDYTVTGEGSPSGGTVTTTLAYAVGGRLSIIRDVPATQPTDYLQGDPFPAESHERALDKLTMIVQQLKEITDRALVIPPGEDPLPALPSAADRALRLQGYDSNGDPVATLPTGGDATGLALDLLNALNAAKGAGQVGFGATPAYNTSTVGRKLQEWISPADYGAVGDGTTDDTVALQQAITAAANGVLHMPRGKNYRISSALSVAAKTTLLAYGAKINTGASHITALSVTASDVDILGLEVQGAGNSSYNSNGRLIVLQGTDNGASVAPTRIRNIRIVGAKLHGAGRAAIKAQYADAVKVYGGTDIYDIGFTGIEFLSCNDYQVWGNKIKDVTPGTAGTSYGAFASRTNDGDLTRNPICSGGFFSYNRVENVDWEGLDCHGGENLDFSHNTLINCGDSNAAIAIIHADDSGGTPIAGATNTRIVGNTIYGAQQYGIAFSTPSGSTIFHYNATVSGNTIENCGSSVTTNDIGGMYIGSLRNGTISANTLRYCAPYGIVVKSQYAGSLSIVGNTFDRIVSNSETTPAPILIDRGASGTGAIMISGNVLRLAGLGETYEAVNGVRVVSTDGGNVRIGANHFDAAGTKYSLTAAQWAGISDAVVNFGDDSIAVTTSVSTASKVITLPTAHSGNTLYNPSAVIWRATSNERTLIQVARTSTTTITVTVYTASGSNFAANGNIEFFWRTSGV